MADQKKSCIVAGDVSALGWLAKPVFVLWPFCTGRYWICTPSLFLTVPSAKNIFGHSTCSHRKHYIIVSLKSSSGYAGHLTGTLYNLDYCFKKTLWGEPKDVFWGLVWESDPADTYWPKLYLTGATRPVGLFAWLCSCKELFAGLSPHSLVDRTHLSLGGLWALQKPEQGSHFQKQRLCQSTPRTLCLCVL